MIVFISTFAVAAHSILCPNDTLDAQLITRVFTQRWLFLFGYSSYEQFTGTINATRLNFQQQECSLKHIVFGDISFTMI